MSRLLEGDVGSGKTLIAAAISYLITHNLNRDIENKKRLQVAYMAPTEILATQHFESFQKMFIGAGVEIGLLTGKVCKKFPSKINPNSSTNISKNQLKKWIESGEISIVIGTHSLIQDGISFQNLALAVVDEQHRFGVRQRAKLANKKSQTKKTLVANDLKNLTNKKQTIETQKEKLPHLLSMTATPIPRTLALTIFGDLDLTVIDEMPKNRKKIDTQIIQEKDREKIYLEIAKEIKAGYQAYIIVPRIDELDDEDMQNNKKLNLRSVSSETKSLISFFNDKNKLDINIVGIHSKINKEEKEKIMQDFANKRIDVLVATSLVEVGVNVPNASRMIIESAERFGLAQLHQLRGRIGRGERESICYLFTNSTSDITSERLSSLLKAKNGFELAEYDLAQRGIGSLMSGKQWGVSDLAMEAIKNIKLVEAAREEARKIIQADRELGKYPMLREIIFVKEKVHME
jgi:ATP-dependent DNA helicase RecG